MASIIGPEDACRESAPKPSDASCRGPRRTNRRVGCPQIPTHPRLVRYSILLRHEFHCHGRAAWPPSLTALCDSRATHTVFLVVPPSGRCKFNLITVKRPGMHVDAFGSKHSQDTGLPVGAGCQSCDRLWCIPRQEEGRQCEPTRTSAPIMDLITPVAFTTLLMSRHFYGFHLVWLLTLRPGSHPREPENGRGDDSTACTNQQNFFICSCGRHDEYSLNEAVSLNSSASGNPSLPTCSQRNRMPGNVRRKASSEHEW